MTAIAPPQFRDLTNDECNALLARTKFGRVAFSQHDRVDIQPIHYVSDGQWIFARTSSGAKLATMLHNPWCAFEVDEVRDTFDWSSVVIKGTFSVLDPKVGSLHTYQRAELQLRKVMPATFTTQDPVAHRDVIIGIFIREMTGRMAQS